MVVRQYWFLYTPGLKEYTFSFPLILRMNDFFFFWSFVLLGPHPRHMEVPRLGVQSELQLPVYTTATATWDLNCVWDPHHSLGQCRILNH